MSPEAVAALSPALAPSRPPVVATAGVATVGVATAGGVTAAGVTAAVRGVEAATAEEVTAEAAETAVVALAIAVVVAIAVVGTAAAAGDSETGPAQPWEPERKVAPDPSRENEKCQAGLGTNAVEWKQRGGGAAATRPSQSS